MGWNIATFYRFTDLDQLEALQENLRNYCGTHDICGLILIAPEGVNATISSQGDSLAQFFKKYSERFSLEPEDIKCSASHDKPFYRMKVKLKREIITMRAPEVDPREVTGKFVSPEEWNELISDPDLLLIDTRNDFEMKLGAFKNAVNPEIEDFTDFNEYVDKELEPEKHKRVAMYCTGGIRCEKASGYMLKHGFHEVYQLRGGILKYLEEIPEEQSLWEGECFVFDQRVAVDHNLEESRTWVVCYGCRLPLHIDETSSPDYEYGVSCPQCAANLTPKRISTLRNRTKIMADRYGIYNKPT